MTVCDECGLPLLLCSALAFIQDMCLAATRGEIWLAQYTARRALENLRLYAYEEE
jgi:hypothetical protein